MTFEWASTAMLLHSDELSDSCCQSVHLRSFNNELALSRIVTKFLTAV